MISGDDIRWGVAALRWGRGEPPRDDYERSVHADLTAAESQARVLATLDRVEAASAGLRDARDDLEAS